jgi:autotransporter-associated beta strand protein
MTPWQPSAFEWDNGAGTTTWGDPPGAGNTNWYHVESGLDNTTPSVNADILFGNKPSTNQTVTLDSTNRRVNSLTFDAGINYTLDGAGSLLMGDTTLAGLPSINVNDYNNAQGQHKINLPITLAEELRINNYSFSTLCLNGAITTGGNDIKVNGTGATNFNADINGSGNIIKNSAGILTINSNNSDGATPWTGNLTVNGGMVVVTANGALGTTGGTTTVNNGGVLAFRDTTGSGLTYSVAEAVTIRGNGVFRGGEGQTGAIYNDGGNNSFTGNITMAANSAIGSRDGVLTLSGVISGGFSLTKLGEGVVSLSGTNTYSGATIIQDGVLRVTAEAALPGGFATAAPSGGNLQLAGGVLEIGTATTFSRRLGTAADQVQWTGDGGFSAFGANRTVTLTNSGGTTNGTLTWNAGSFVPTGNALLLSSDYANATVTLTNAINLGAGNREIRVANGSAAIDGVISGVISNGGLIKSGEGTLNISGANTYTGTTEIRGGALRGTISANSNITLNGGVLELGANFTRSLGTGGANVQWTGDGGFAAQGANRQVLLNNSTAAVTWGTTANFVGANNQLILGSRSSDFTLQFDSAINLGGGNRTIRVVDSAAAATRAEARLTRALSNGNLILVGDGRLDTNVANGSLAGTVAIEGAELRLNVSGTMTAVTGFTVSGGGRLTLDNAGTSLAATGGTNSTNRIGDTASVTLAGGTLNYLGRDGTNGTETIGNIILAAGSANTVNVARGGTSTAILTSTGLTRNVGATVDILRPNTSSNLRFSGAPALDDGILAFATVNGTDFATHTGNNTNVTAFTGYNTANEGGTWTATSNVAPTADQTLTASRTVNSIKLGSGIDINASGNTLTLDSGGLLSTGAAKSIISNGTLTAGTTADELIAHVYGAGGLEISAVLANNGDPVGLTKTGDGVLTLLGAAANTFSGTTYVNEGTLALAKSDGVQSLGGTIIVSDGRGTDILRLDTNEQIANTANVTLRGSEYGTGETILQFNGTTGVGVTETFSTLTIEGHSVIDFAGGNVCSPNFLFLDELLMASADSRLYVRNWIDFTDFLLVRNTADIGAVLSRIKFEGYGDTSYWQDYDAQYSRITPVPEPATYGAMLMAAGLGFFGYRRWRKAQPVQSAKA